MPVPQFRTLAQEVSPTTPTVLFENNYSWQNYTQAQNVYIWGITVVNTDENNTHRVSIGLARAGDAINQLKQFTYYRLPLLPFQTLMYNFNQGIMPGDRIFWLSDDETLAANVTGIVGQNNQA